MTKAREENDLYMAAYPDDEFVGYNVTREQAEQMVKAAVRRGWFVWADPREADRVFVILPRGAYNKDEAPAGVAAFPVNRATLYSSLLRKAGR